MCVWLAVLPQQQLPSPSSQLAVDRSPTLSSHPSFTASSHSLLSASPPQPDFPHCCKLATVLALPYSLCSCTSRHVSMGRSRAGGAAEESNKKKSKKEQVEEEDETEAGEEDEEALEEDDKENEQPEEQKEDEDGEEEQEAGDGNEEDGAAANKGKRKHAVAESTSNKKAKAAAGDGHSVVLAYMLRMNRPYSAINVADNIQGALSKSQTVKVLEDLTSQGDAPSTHHPQHAHTADSTHAADEDG